MILDELQHVDDLTADESVAVVRAYDDTLVSESHEEAFAAASGVFQRLRPNLPPALLAIELEVLLALAPGDPVAMAHCA
ncbi:hypothetical protein [Azospirillum sp. ST 5-10]|uniref:hypothetical protein n=1 Tax=unclassified Azospirillum TaxID=2630922 RepID=UPI003F49C715